MTCVSKAVVLGRAQGNSNVVKRWTREVNLSYMEMGQGDKEGKGRFGCFLCASYL